MAAKKAELQPEATRPSHWDPQLSVSISLMGLAFSRSSLYFGNSLVVKVDFRGMFWVEDVLNSAKGLMLNRSVRKMSLVAQSILHHQNLLPIIGQNRDLLITDSQTKYVRQNFTVKVKIRFSCTHRKRRQRHSRFAQTGWVLRGILI